MLLRHVLHLLVFVGVRRCQEESLGDDYGRKLSRGHWRCWQQMVRYASPEAPRDGNPYVDLHHLLHKIWMNGFPTSSACCHPHYGPEGLVGCWTETFNYSFCCDANPTLPKRCTKSGAVFELEIAADGSEVVGIRKSHSALTARERKWECASLDDVGIYFHEVFFMGSDKAFLFHNYLNLYEPLLSTLPETPHILEVGVNGGHSLAVWGFWWPEGHVLGIDVTLERAFQPQSRLYGLGANVSGNIAIMLGNSTDPALSSGLAARGEAFDLIVDDGCHQGDFQIQTFENLWPLVKPGGYYFVEDVGMYPEEAPEGGDATAYFKELVNEVYKIQRVDFNFMIHFTDSPSREAVHKRDWRSDIEYIMFRNMVVIVKKFDAFEDFNRYDEDFN